MPPSLAVNGVTLTLLYLGVILILAKLLEESFSRIRLVPFVGAVVAGVVLGNGVLGFVKVNSIIQFISLLGITLLLFLSGAEEFEVGRGSLNARVTAAAAVELALPFTLIYLSLRALNVSITPLLAIPLIMTSVGPLARLLMDINLSRTELGNMLFMQGALVEVASVVAFAILVTARLGGSLLTLIGIAVLIAAIFTVGRWVSRALEWVEGYVKAREVEFAAAISLVLVISFLAEAVNFNPAMAALFLGILLRDYLKDRPELLEKLHGFTYGFFEPIFFVSIGLYFVRLSPDLLMTSLLIALILLSSKVAAGALASMVVGGSPIINGLGTSTKGGVDVSLLLVLLTTGLITRLTYSYLTLAITVNSVVAPLLVRTVVKPTTGVNPLIRVKLNNNVMSISEYAKPLTVTCSDNLRIVIDRMVERGVRAVVVVNSEGKPLGYLTMQQLLEIDPATYGMTPACDLPLNELTTVTTKARIIDVLRRFRGFEDPVIGVVNDDGVLVATIYERELLRLLITV
ncbi:MAG: cation:proton antiporter [Caldivirga sp.]|jgi:Kef-type K+ transport system membrane component KefB|uniref:cation:proton antiporter domain-containing protein n=1 Tax=Caldivirga sp. MU80 TaxID=1650354 RepID=UPI000830DB68|nr:cation:proton antiporter [Caldivirga sp. MU80]